ncbi:hypothetical protein X975_04976, partial [Stegodyphus mimosarum]
MSLFVPSISHLQGKNLHSKSSGLFHYLMLFFLTVIV